MPGGCAKLQWSIYLHDGGEGRDSGETMMMVVGLPPDKRPTVTGSEIWISLPVPEKSITFCFIITGSQADNSYLATEAPLEGPLLKVPCPSQLPGTIFPHGLHLTVGVASPLQSTSDALVRGGSVLAGNEGHQRCSVWKFWKTAAFAPRNSF